MLQDESLQPLWASLAGVSATLARAVLSCASLLIYCDTVVAWVIGLRREPQAELLPVLHVAWRKREIALAQIDGE